MKKVKAIFRRVAIFPVFLVILLANVPALATITEYYSRSAFEAAVPSALVQDWDSFEHGYCFPNGTANSQGITYNSSYGDAMVTTDFLPSTEPCSLGQNENGYFYSIDTITFIFATPILAFGIDVNTASTADDTFQGITDLGQVASSYFDCFSGSECGQFIGFTSSEAFCEVTIGLAQGATPASYTLDTLRYQPAPLPASLLLLGSGLAGLGLLRFRKRVKV